MFSYRRRGLLASVLLLAGVVSYVQAAEPPKVAETPKGPALADSRGMTLYTFDKDTAGSGKSVCNGTCATNWPPMYAAPGAKGGGDWSVITRDDGKPQWAWKGKPLYFWSKDQKAGDRTGDGLNNVWHAAQP